MSIERRVLATVGIIERIQTAGLSFGHAEMLELVSRLGIYGAANHLDLPSVGIAYRWHKSLKALWEVNPELANQLDTSYLTRSGKAT